MKYVVVTGGVVSGLGKGVTASSIGVLLKGCGLRVTSIKIDPYLNTDAGTMSPFEHGEVFVLDDGGEVDLDLGNYERFLDITLTRDNNITTGKIYQSVINKERRGDYLGSTVQVVPHITNEIQDWIEKVARIPVDGRKGEPEVCVIELGGTVGDIESMPFLEAISQFQDRVGPENFCLVHVTLVPVLGVVGEQKSNPTIHSVRQLRSLGVTPHLLACRSAKPLEQSTRDKITRLCNTPATHILNIFDVPNIWHVPLLLRDQKAHLAILRKFKLFNGEIPYPRLQEWVKMAERCDKLSIPVKIAMVGKYTGLSDSYLSVIKALLHASNACGRKLELQWVAASDLEDNVKDESPDVHASAWEALKASDGILVPGGFGDRGVEGKILAAKYAREHRVPFLGICLGLQIAVIEFARSVLGMKEANSTEFDQATPHPCVVYMPEVSKTHMGGTMRLGSRKTILNSPNSITAKLYRQAECVDERHRHRYEVNPEMVDKLETAGLQFVGKDETGRRMEIMEYPGHPFYVAVQFHPEFKSRPVKPSAVFLGLVMAASGQLDAYLSQAGVHLKAPENGVVEYPKVPENCVNEYIRAPADKAGEYLKTCTNGTGEYVESPSNGLGEYLKASTCGTGVYLKASSNGVGEYPEASTNGVAEYPKPFANGTGKYACSSTNRSGDYRNACCTNGNVEHSKASTNGTGDYPKASTNGMREFSKPSILVGEYAKTLPNGVGHSPKASPNGMGYSPNASPNGVGYKAKSSPFGEGQYPKASANGVGEYPKASANGVGGESKVLGNGVGEYLKVTANGVGKHFEAAENGLQHHRATSNGVGDYPKAKANGVGEHSKSPANGVGEYPRSSANGVGEYTKASANGVGEYSKASANGVGEYPYPKTRANGVAEYSKSSSNGVGEYYPTPSANGVGEYRKSSANVLEEHPKSSANGVGMYPEAFANVSGVCLKDSANGVGERPAANGSHSITRGRS